MDKDIDKNNDIKEDAADMKSDDASIADKKSVDEKAKAEETEIVSTDPNEIYGDEEEALEPDVTPPGSSRNLWIIAGLVVVILVLAGGIGWYYYNNSEAKAKKDTADQMYVAQLTTYYNEYVQAQQDYFTALNDQFSSYEETSAHKFTADDVQAIKGATDMFEQRGEAALDGIIAIKAPKDKAKAQEQVVSAAKEVKKTVLPASLKAQRDIKKGSTMQSFIDDSEKVFKEQNTSVEKVFSDFQKALSDAGVQMNTGSGTESGN